MNNKWMKRGDCNNNKRECESGGKMRGFTITQLSSQIIALGSLRRDHLQEDYFGRIF